VRRATPDEWPDTVWTDFLIGEATLTVDLAK
jgi:hypothetical protein